MNSQGQFASPAGQEQKKARHSQNLVPVAIKNILDFEGESMQIVGMDVHMVVIVGVIRAVDVTSTRITYTIDDHSGTIDAVQWLESDQSSEDPARTSLMEMTYCRVSGAIRFQMGKRNLIVFRILPLTDLNLITTHLLEVMHSVLKLQQLHTLQEAKADVKPAASGIMSNSLVGTAGLDGMGGGTSVGGGFAGMQGLTGQQRTVYQVIHQCIDEAGVARDAIYASLKGNVNRPQVDDVLDFLSSEGHIYSTIDDDHFKSTDG